MTPVARVALGVFLVAGAGPAGFLVYRIVFDGRLPVHQSAPSTVGTASAQRMPGAPVDAKASRPIPERLPQFTLKDASGAPHQPSQWRGHPLVINFWATWCEPCRREIPLLKALHARAAPNGLEVVGIAIDFKAAAVKYAADLHMDYLLLMGEDDGLPVVESLGMEPVLPFTVFADGQGRIVTIKMGELHPDEADLILHQVEDVDSGRIVLASAQQQIAAGLKNLAIARAKSGQATTS